MGMHHQLARHPTVHYDRKYSSEKEARDCWHVQTAAKHHKVPLGKLAKMVAGGINLLNAIVSLVAAIVQYS